MAFKSFTDYLLLEKKYSKLTVAAYENDLKTFKKFIKEEYDSNDIQSINYAQIRNWIVFLVESNISNRSINRKMSSLNTYYKFLMKIGEIQTNPLAKHKALKTSKKIQIPFSETEINRVLDELHFEDDFEGNIFTCMSAIDRSKLFHQSAMPHYTPIANIFDKDFELKKETADMHDIIQQAANRFELPIKQKSGNLILALHAQISSSKIDTAHMTNVISNLIDNAIKYCNQSPELLISTSSDEHNLYITVKDNGIGMSREELKNIFTKFYRIPTGNIHTTKGFGIGLNYVKFIVEEHKGNISVESKLNEGSTFLIKLPIV